MWESIGILPPPSLLPPLPSLLLPSYPSLLSLTFLLLTISSSAPPAFCLAPPISLSFFFHCLLVFCASLVSQRIPLVAQLRDSAGKLRLFKARSAGKASSCWKQAAWTWRTSSHVYTLAHINTDTHTHTSLFYPAFLLACLPSFQTWKMPFSVRFTVFTLAVDICDWNKGGIFS